MEAIKKQLLEEVSRKVDGVSFSEISLELFCNELTSFTKENYPRRIKQDSLGVEYAISLSTMKTWRTGKSISNKHLNWLSQFLGFQDFREYNSWEGNQIHEITKERHSFFNTRRIVIVLSLVTAIGLLIANFSSAYSLSQLSRSVINALTKQIDEEPTNYKQEPSDNRPNFVSNQDSFEVKPLTIINDKDSMADVSLKTPIKHSITMILDASFRNVSFYRGGKSVLPDQSGTNLYVFKLDEQQLLEDWEVVSREDTCRETFAIDRSKTVIFSCD